MTRAEDILVLHGSSDDDEATGDSIQEFLSEILGTQLPWQPDAAHLPIWQDIQRCLPPEAVDWTDSLAESVVGDIGGGVTQNGETLTVDAATDRILALSNSLLEGTIECRSQSRLAIERLTGPPEAAPDVQHSYTSLKSFDDCPRQHYLDYVVKAFRDYTLRDGDWTESDDGPSQQTVGILFHDTADIAADENTTSHDGWYSICERLANQQRAHNALPAAKACIDRYFELNISDWEIVDAEREFAMSINGEEIVGYIDAVYRTLVTSRMRNLLLMHTASGVHTTSFHVPQRSLRPRN